MSKLDRGVDSGLQSHCPRRPNGVPGSGLETESSPIRIPFRKGEPEPFVTPDLQFKFQDLTPDPDPMCDLLAHPLDGRQLGHCSGRDRNNRAEQY